MWVIPDFGVRDREVRVIPNSGHPSVVTGTVARESVSSCPRAGCGRSASLVIGFLFLPETKDGDRGAGQSFRTCL
jgi:hypothetical protein